MQRPRLPGKVPEPSVTEIDEHESSGHAVYRTWCKHCVAAKGRGNPHLADGEEGEVAEVAFDYGYMSRDSAKCLPMICGRDRQTQSHAASFVKAKGRDPYALAYVTSFVHGLGYKRVVFRSDNEPALLAMLKVVSDNLPGVEVVPKNSPEGDHAANGLAEIGVREAKGQTRAIRSQLESNLGTRLEEDEPVLTWIPRHGVNCIN